MADAYYLNLEGVDKAIRCLSISQLAEVWYDVEFDFYDDFDFVPATFQYIVPAAMGYLVYVRNSDLFQFADIIGSRDIAVLLDGVDILASVGTAQPFLSGPLETVAGKTLRLENFARDRAFTFFNNTNYAEGMRAKISEIRIYNDSNTLVHRYNATSQGATGGNTWTDLIGNLDLTIQNGAVDQWIQYDDGLSIIPTDWQRKVRRAPTNVTGSLTGFTGVFTEASLPAEIFSVAAKDVGYLTFDGVDDHVTIPSIALSGDYHIKLDCEIATSTGRQALFGSGSDFIRLNAVGASSTVVRVNNGAGADVTVSNSQFLGRRVVWELIRQSGSISLIVDGNQYNDILTNTSDFDISLIGSKDTVRPDVDSALIKLYGFELVGARNYNPAASGGTGLILPNVLDSSGATDGTLVNFPADPWVTLSKAGQDIRICTDADGVNQLPLEIVNFDTVNNKAVIWTRFPTFDTNTSLWIFYGNSNAVGYAVGDVFGRNAVWVDYAFVFNLQGGLSDSSGNVPDCTNDGAAVSTPSGYSFNGSQFIKTYLNNTNLPLNATISAMTTPADTNTFKAVISNNTQSGSSLGIFLGFTNTEGVVFRTANVGNATGNTPATVRSLIHGVSNSLGNYAYLDGSFGGSSLQALNANEVAGTSGNIGNLSSNNGDDFVGEIEWIHYKKSEKAASEIETEYTNQSSPATFWSTDEPVSTTETGLQVTDWTRRARIQTNHATATIDGFTGLLTEDNLPSDFWDYVESGETALLLRDTDTVSLPNPNRSLLVNVGDWLEYKGKALSGNSGNYIILAEFTSFRLAFHPSFILYNTSQQGTQIVPISPYTRPVVGEIFTIRVERVDATTIKFILNGADLGNFPLSFPFVVSNLFGTVNAPFKGEHFYLRASENGGLSETMFYDPAISNTTQLIDSYGGLTAVLENFNSTADIYVDGGSAGGDVRVALNSDGVDQMPLEIVSFDALAQTTQIKTTFPAFATGEDFWLFYGKDGETQPAPNGAFGSDFVTRPASPSQLYLDAENANIANPATFWTAYASESTIPQVSNFVFVGETFVNVLYNSALEKQSNFTDSLSVLNALSSANISKSVQLETSVQVLVSSQSNIRKSMPFIGSTNSLVSSNGSFVKTANIVGLSESLYFNEGSLSKVAYIQAETVSLVSASSNISKSISLSGLTEVLVSSRSFIAIDGVINFDGLSLVGISSNAIISKSAVLNGVVSSYAYLSEANITKQSTLLGTGSFVSVSNESLLIPSISMFGFSGVESISSGRVINLSEVNNLIDAPLINAQSIAESMVMAIGISDDVINAISKETQSINPK